MGSPAGASNLTRDVLLEMVRQNQLTSSFSLDRITDDNANLRLNDGTASIGFIYRHIGETMNLFAQMLGRATDVTNTTIGKIDTGQHHDTTYSRTLVERGYRTLHELVETSKGDDWLEPVDTPFFGTVSRIRLFAHVLYHTSNHAGQISLTLARGK